MAKNKDNYRVFSHKQRREELKKYREAKRERETAFKLMLRALRKRRREEVC